MWLLAVCLLICAVAFAQSTTEGAVSGTVYDSTGAVVPNATIVVHNNATNAEQTVTSDSTGNFRATSLKPSVYTVTVTAAGFAPYKAQQVIVNVGTVTDLSPRLNVGNAAETVTVSAEAPQINTTSADFAPVLNNTAISNLPINGGRWSNFVLLTPTVVNDGSGFGLVSFRGMSVLLNNNTVDGADNNQAFFSEERGRTRAGYSSAKAAVQEFQVNTSNYSAEYGRSAGGVINTVTKSGTNALHGEAYFYDRDNAWGAMNPFTLLTTQDATGAFVTNSYKPTDVRKISGFAIGGPIKKDKLFFFLAFDWFKRNFPGTAVPSSAKTFFVVPSASSSAITTLASNLGASVSLCGGTALACYTNGLTGLLSETGPVPRLGEQFIYFPKLDWQVSNKHRLSLEFNRMRWASPAGIQTQATNTDAINAFGNDYVKDTWGIARLDSMVTNNISNQVRYQYGRDFEFENPQPPTAYDRANFITSPNFPGYTNPLGFAPDVFITGGFDMGVVSFLTRPKYPDEYRHQIADTMSWSHGKHLFKFGMDFSHVNDTAVHNEFQFGAYSYSNIQNYLSDLYKPNSCTVTGFPAHTAPCYSSYKQGFGPLGFQMSTNDIAFFFQDDWKMLPRLTLSLGLRYEHEQLPSPFSNLVNPDFPQTGKMPSDKNNFGPRIGFAWDVWGDGKTALRGGWGIYYGRVINSTIFSALTATGMPAGQNLYSYTSTTGLTAGITLPKILDPSVLPTGGASKPSLFYFDPNFQLPQIHQLDLTFEHEIGWNTVVSLSYLGSFGRQLPSFIDTNLTAPASNLTYTITDANTEGPLGPSGTKYVIPFYTTRPNAKYGPVTDIFSGITSNYNAMVFQVNHRMSRHIQFATNLTWGRSFDYNQNQQTFTDTNDFLFPTDPNLVREGYGRSKYDVPLRFVFHAVAESPWHKSGVAGFFANGWQIAPIFQWQNGLPFTMQASGGPSGTAQGGINGSGTGTGYTSAQGNFSGFNFIPGIGRNTFRGPNTAVMDLKISKIIAYRERYSVEFSGEGFNLFNHVNTTGINTTGYLLGGTAAAPTMQFCGTAAPGQAATPCNTVFGSLSNGNSNFAYSPRQVQLGIRVKF
ncbi:MAG: TonB-dependent receptor [Acidobacteriia bacterium]|nr:TonB-dependent receptor [Terriglobia bacterium]